MIVCLAESMYPTAAQASPVVAMRIKPVTVFFSEAREIAGLSLDAKEGCEIGGSLFGSQSPGGTLVVCLAVPHGPKATCQPLYFEDDPAHVLRLDQELNERFGLRWLGTFHLHPGTNGEPSGTDEQQVRRSAVKNGRRIGLQIITNLIEPARSVWGWRTGPERRPTVRFSNHLYFDAPVGLHTRVPLRLLPGVSPIRQALMADPLWTEERLGWHWATVAMGRIDTDQVDADEVASWQPQTAVLPPVAPNHGAPMCLTLEDF